MYAFFKGKIESVLKDRIIKRKTRRSKNKYILTSKRRWYETVWLLVSWNIKLF